MSRYTSHCDNCGWSGGPYRTQGKADYATRQHSCAKQIRRAESAKRAAARQAAIDRAPKPCLHKRADHQHGTYACYTLDRCRCRPCSDANAAYERKRARLHAYGRWDGLVDADPVRQHAQALLAAGMGHKQIIELAGGSGGVWTKLMYGVGGRPPSRRVTQRTADAYLSIPLPTSPAELPAWRNIDSRGTRRRLQALACLGWSVGALADRYSVDRQCLDGALHGRKVRTGTAVVVDRMFTELWETLAPENTHRQRISASRTRNRARALGWAPPLGWDDIDLDDAPQTGESVTLDDIAVDALIAGQPVTTGDTERRTAALILTANGLSSRAIADRLGVAPRTVQRWRTEAAA